MHICNPESHEWSRRCEILVLAVTVSMTLTLLLTRTSYSATIRVPADQSTIQLGIEASSAGDTVLVACGTYSEKNLVLRSGICLRGERSGPDCVTINPAFLGRILELEGVDSTTVIEGITLMNGSALRAGFGKKAAGGAVSMIESAPVFRDCVFKESRSEYGGAVLALCSQPTFENCRFEENRARAGEFILRLNCGFPPPEKSQQFCCSAGGAVLVLDSHVVFERCVFSGNTARHRGSALSARRSIVKFRGCTLVNNESASVIDATSGSRIFITRSILAFNATDEVVSCWKNNLAEFLCNDVFGNQKNEIDGNYKGCLRGFGVINANFSADPRFCNLEGGDLSLKEGSPCLAGNHPRGTACGLIGAGSSVCKPTSAEGASWSSLKSLYRE